MIQPNPQTGDEQEHNGIVAREESQNIVAIVPQMNETVQPNQTNDEQEEVVASVSDTEQPPNEITGNERATLNQDTVHEVSQIEVSVDVKHALPAVHVDDDDEIMMNALYDVVSHESGNVSNENDSGDQHPSDALAGIQLDQNEKAEFRDGKIIVTKLVDNDLEMMYTYGEKPNALQPLYQVKLNDAVSENIPFKENVCADIFGLIIDVLIHFNFLCWLVLTQYNRDEKIVLIWLKLTINLWK